MPLAERIGAAEFRDRYGDAAFVAAALAVARDRIEDRVRGDVNDPDAIELELAGEELHSFMQFKDHDNGGYEAHDYGTLTADTIAEIVPMLDVPEDVETLGRPPLNLSDAMQQISDRKTFVHEQLPPIACELEGVSVMVGYTGDYLLIHVHAEDRYFDPPEAALPGEGCGELAVHPDSASDEDLAAAIAFARELQHQVAAGMSGLRLGTCQALEGEEICARPVFHREGDPAFCDWHDD